MKDKISRNNAMDDVMQGIDCGANSLACFNYVDPTTYERVGAKLLLQACLCPAAVLAANVSLLEAEDASSHSHGIPCADAFAMDPHGLQEYRRMCRSQLMCGLMCGGFPVVYTENLIQRQRIRTKYRLHDATSLSEIGAGCCYPCSIFQSHTFLYVSTHQQPVNPRTSGTTPHGPLIGALRAMQRCPPSQDVAAAKQKSYPTAGKAPALKASEQPQVSVSCISAIKKTEASIPRVEDAMHTTLRQAMVAAGATATLGNVSASGLASSFGVTPNPAVNLYSQELGETRRAEHGTLLVSTSSAGSTRTRASSIPPPEATDSPHVGAPPVDPSYAEGDKKDIARGSSMSIPVPSRLSVAGATRSEAKADPVAARQSSASLNSGQEFRPLLEAPNQSHQVMHRFEDVPRHLAQQANTMVQSGRSPRVTVASGASVSTSLFSLDPSASYTSPLPLPVVSAPMQSTGTAISISRTSPRPSFALGPAELMLPPLPTPGSSRDLQAPATYDTITSSKLSSMIDHVILNDSGSAAGRGSSGAGGSGCGTVLNSIDTNIPWDNYRHSVMAPIAEAEVEEGTCSSIKLPCSQIVQEAAETSADRDVMAQRVSSQTLLSDISSNPPQYLCAHGPESGKGTPLRTGQSSTGGSQRACSSGFVGCAAASPACAGGAALTTLARMASDSGVTNAVAAPGNSACGGNLHGRKQGQGVPISPPPRRTPPPTGGLAGQSMAAAGADARTASRRNHSAGRDEGEDIDDGMGASADNFSQALGTPQQVLLQGPSHQQGSQGRYGAAAGRPARASAATPQRPAFVFVGPASDNDDVNLASIRPSFIDGPETQHLKEALRAAGEKADALAGTQQASAAAFTPASTSQARKAAGATHSPLSGSERVVALSSTVTTLQQRGSGTRRYGVAPASTLSEVVANGAGFSGGLSAVCPDASFYADAASQDDSVDASMEDDASSVIDGPVSSGEGSSVVTEPHLSATMPPIGNTVSGTNGDDDAKLPAGDALVSIAVAAAPRSGESPLQIDQAADPSESAAFGTARHSTSGLSNGEPNAGYESMADSLCTSQHRQRHWVNWMAQSLGMSMVTNSVAVRPAYGSNKVAGGPGSKAALRQGSSHVSGNQRMPRPVLQESSDGMYNQWR